MQVNRESAHENELSRFAIEKKKNGERSKMREECPLSTSYYVQEICGGTGLDTISD